MRTFAARSLAIAAVIAAAALARPLSAQDPFEIQVYEYDLVPVGVWNL